VGEIVHVRDGVEALAMVERGGLDPDLALIDLRMPRVDGFALLVAFSNNVDLTFPMVVLTSSSAPDDAIRSRLRNARRVVVKPETIPEMSAALKVSIDAVWRAAANDGPRRDPARLEAKNAARDSARTAAAVRSAANLAGIGGWEVDFVTQRANLSPELSNLLGAARLEMSIAEADAIWVDDDAASFSAALQLAAKNGENLKFEGRSFAPDGSCRWWRLLGEPVLVDSYCVALRGVAQDITEWREPLEPTAGPDDAIASPPVTPPRAHA
ncbi:MAG TPA: response regulator, partial [Phenylobacterium sp.]|jgi:CheY-like chemotaxis protein|nr:response regulator [Phenylobacterium sp.]